MASSSTRSRRSVGPDTNSLRPTRVFKTERFRSAALSGAIDADIHTIENGYRAEGLPEAIEVVNQRLGSGRYAGADLPGGYILVRDAASGRTAGNVQLKTLQLGFFRF